MPKRAKGIYKTVRTFDKKKYVLSEQFHSKQEARGYAGAKRKAGLLARVVKGTDPFWKYAVYVTWPVRR